ncbi:MAG: ABC transporter ATP-binding protein [Bacillota bacterium]|nr:ABC transporter ATP-binding protein [Bacillota bacterium]
MSLEVSELTVTYGAIRAVGRVSLQIPEGATVTILGANGAGKSSVLRAIMGLIPSQGSVALFGKRVDGLPVHVRSALGMQLVPEGRLVFAGLSVEANLMAGAYNHRRDSAGIARDMDRTMSMFPILKERFDQRAGTLSGGEQQMLAIARALMARPRLLMMDEPSMGLAPIIVEQLADALLAIRRTGVTALLVEQNARLALDISDYAYFLQLGEVVLEGPSSEMKEDPRVKKVYLGI